MSNNLLCLGIYLIFILFLNFLKGILFCLKERLVYFRKLMIKIKKGKEVWNHIFLKQNIQMWCIQNCVTLNFSVSQYSIKGSLKILRNPLVMMLSSLPTLYSSSGVEYSCYWYSLQSLRILSEDSLQGERKLVYLLTSWFPKQLLPLLAQSFPEALLCGSYNL